MSTNMTGFGEFSKIFAFLSINMDESSLSIERVKSSSLNCCLDR